MLYLHYGDVVLFVGAVGLHTSPNKKNCVHGCKHTLEDGHYTTALQHMHTNALTERDRDGETLTNF